MLLPPDAIATRQHAWCVQWLVRGHIRQLCFEMPKALSICSTQPQVQKRMNWSTFGISSNGCDGKIQRRPLQR